MNVYIYEYNIPNKSKKVYNHINKSIQVDI